jgi:S-formylglutathione hydrolase
MSKLLQTASNKCYGGYVKTFKHASASTKTDMVFSVFFPKETELAGASVPIILYLSGLTCTDQNALTKGGFQREAARRGVCMVFPDTSPRGANVEGEAESWDFGVGAGFYIKATTPKYKHNYDMYTYVNEELPALLSSEFPLGLDHKRLSIMGHSMGGHGALISALKNPGRYASCSAFSPICNPMNCPWGVKAFSGYLGPNHDAWREWDASELARAYTGAPLSILADQGAADDFLAKKQLLPESLVDAVKQAKNHLSLHMRMQDGYGGCALAPLH